MVNPNIDLAVELDKRIDRLTELYRNVRQENRMLKNEVTQLTSQLKKVVDSKTEIEEQYGQLKMARVFESSPEEIQQTKRRINQLVREIDKCIALLNR
jgi:predicted  nucleic acid-binding Zn-ribbon protein